METIDTLVHHIAGYLSGRERACGKKVDYQSEGSAVRNAERATLRYNSEKEAYPCIWCGGWHIGRKMTQEEVREILDMLDREA